MRKLLGWLLVGCAIAFGVVAFLVGTQRADQEQGTRGAGVANAAQPPRDAGTTTAKEPGARPKPKVEVANAERSDWQEWQSTLGVVKAANNMSVKTAVAGRITRIQKSGVHVEQGEILVQLDDGKERAQLDAKLAALDRVRSAYQRARELTDRKVSSSASLQSAETDLRLAQADVAFQRALLADYVIRAPFAGEVGLHDLIEGQRIDPGQTLFAFQDTEVLLVEFRIPVDFAGKSPVGMSVMVESRAPEISLPVPVIVSSPDVDNETSTIRMRAELPGGVGFRPGMSPRVRYATRKIPDVITIPDIALVDSAYGASIFVVGQDGGVQQRFVAVNGNYDGRVAVSGDVQQGDTVVVTGQMRLYPGASVSPQPFQMPAEKLVSAVKANGQK